MKQSIIDAALKHAHDTRSVMIGSGVIPRLPELLETHFPAQDPFIIADENTYQACGEQVARTLHDRKLQLAGQHIFPGLPRLKPAIENVEAVEQALAGRNAVPVAVGSGTINDIVKLAAHRCGQAYVAVGTAASMDGYTSFASAITHQGVKKVDACPAPRIFIAELEVMLGAPEELSSSGYADLIAKINSGADWIIADFVESEALHREAWDLIQPSLRGWLDNPAGIKQGDPAAIEHLTVGLVMAGLAMQAARSSWPASGAEHLFSHLWEMRGLDKGYVSHGHKVGLGTIAALAFLQNLCQHDFTELDDAARLSSRSTFAASELAIRQNFDDPTLTQACVDETRAKYPADDVLEHRLRKIREGWPQLRAQLQKQAMEPEEVRDRLQAAGCPTTPAEVGLSRETFKADYARIGFLRNRYTSFDMAQDLGVLEVAIEQLFAPTGYWS